MAYPDTNHCIIACDSCYFWRSTDKGQNWEKKRFCDSSFKIWDLEIDFFDKNLGLVIHPQIPYITKDSGNNWEKIEL